MPILRSRAARNSAIALGGLVFLLMLALWLLQTDWAREAALARLRQALRQQNIVLERGRLDYDLFGLEVGLSDVALRSAQAPDLPAVVEFKQARVVLNWNTLSRFSLDLDSAKLSGAKVHIVIDAAGRTNIPQPPPSQGPASEWLIRKLVAKDASLMVEDRQHQVGVTLQPWTLSMTGSAATQKHAISVTTSRTGEITYQGRRLPVDQFELTGTLEKNALQIDRAALASGGTRIDVNGRLDGFNTVDARAKSTLDVAPLALFLGRKERFGGRVQLAANVQGPLEKLKVAGDAVGEELVYDEFSGVNLTAKVAYDGAAKRVQLAESSIESPYGTVNATADIALEAGESRASARVDRLDVEQFARRTKLSLAVASQVSFTANAQWPALDFQKASATGTLRATPTQADAAADRLPIGAEVLFSGRLDQLKAEVKSLAAAGAEASGTIYLANRRNLSGTFTAGSDGLATVLRQANLFLSKNMAMDGFDGRAAIEGTLGGTISSPTVEAALAIEGLQAKQVKGAALQAGLSYADRLVTVAGLALRWKEQSLLGDGTLNLDGNQLNFAARTENVRIETTQPGQVTGALEAQVTGGGTLEEPTASIAVSGAGLMAYGERLGTLAAQAELVGSRLTVTSFRLPQQSLTATGTYQIDTEAYTVEAQAPNAKLTYGTVALTANGAGTLTDPRLVASILGKGITYEGRTHGDLNVTLNVRNHAASIDAAAPKYDTTATARIGIDAPYATTLTVQAKALPLQLEVPLTGAIRATIQGQGNLEQWEKGTATLSAEPIGVEWNKVPVTMDGPVQAEFANGVFTVKPAQLLAAGSKLALSGSLPLDPKSTDGLVRIAGDVDLANAPKLVPDWNQPVGASGTLTLTGEVRGNLRRIEPTATITLRHGTILPANLNPISDIQLSAELKEGTLRIDQLTGTWAKAKMNAQGEFPLGLLPANLPIAFPRKAGPATLKLGLQGLDIASIEGAPADTSGTVALHVEAEAAKGELTSIQGRATVDELRLKVGDIILEQAGKSAIQLVDGVARIESLTLAGPGTELALRGRASLVGDNQVGIRLAGKMETGVLAAWLAPAKMRGPARIQLSVYGPARALQSAGFVELTDGQLLMPQPRIAADSVNARINLTGDRLSIARFEGTLNGGTLNAKGGFRFVAGEARDVDVVLDAKSVYLDYPYGLRTLSNAALSVKQNGSLINLSGDIKIQEGSFRELVTIEGNLLSMLNSSSDPIFIDERNPYLDRTRFNVNARTESPLLVNNNLAKAGVNLDLRLAGNYYRPALLGRITLEEGGELYFSERSYAIERGVITFTNDQKIEPTLDILARTRVARHDISLLIAGGGPEKVSTTLSSDPAVPEQEILAMLITGKSPEEYKNTDTATLASRQALSYFAGSFGSRFTRQLEKATGLSTVRVEPDLIANESNPTARLTVGQDLSPQARLIYSMNLANGGDQIYVAEYDITKRFTTRGIKQIDNTYRFEFRHDLRFGGEKPPSSAARATDRRVIGQVQVPADTPIPEKKLRDKFKNKPGKRYDFFEVRKGLDRLEKLFRDQDLLEARVRVRRELKEKSVDLNLDIEAGPRLNFAYEGWDPSRKLKQQVRSIWSEGVFDAQRTDDAARTLRTALIDDGYLEAAIEPKVTVTDRKLVTFDIQPGKKYSAEELEFPGASGIKESELSGILKRRDLRAALYLDTPKVRDLLQSYYRERGYLDATVRTPQVKFADGQATVRVLVNEGPRYQVASVRFEGNTAIKPELLVEKSELKADEPYQLPLRQVSLDQLRELYYAAGYHDAQVETEVKRDAGKVDLTYRITEGPKEVVEKVEISGNDATSANLIRSQIPLKDGETLEPAKLAEARRNLYSTGAYALVDLERVPTGDVSTAGIKPILLRAKVREVQPFDLRYGAYFDTDRGPGAVIDFTNRNSLGSARAIGGRLRYDSDFREGRVFFSQPLLRRFPVQSIASAFVNRALLPTFITDRVGVSAQQEFRFKRIYLLNYGYRIERVHTYEKVPDEFLPFDVTLRVAPLTFTMNRETRDDILDATKGSFLSHAFEWAPEALGSDVRFIRYYAQYFKYVALGKPAEIPLSGGLKKPRLVYAGAARLGLARGLGGQDLVMSERFFAGGGTTLRGFAQNTLGPKDFLGEPSGGNAVVVINNELRFPMLSIFDGVGFVDVGNAYRLASDISFRDFRKVAGAGLRIRTPYFLIRLDYGFKLDRRPGESRGGFFFSIGQAF